MPATQFSDLGYSGFSWPSLDLLWRSAFGTKFGLSAFAPFLAPGLYLPGWFSQRIRLIGSLEAGFVLWFTLGFFLFAAANQYGYVQFNTAYAILCQ
jgi:hypothetical protein